MASLVLVGGGGHCKAAIDVIEASNKLIAGVVELSECSIRSVLGYQVIGCDGDLPALVERGCEVFITIGQIKSALPRKAAYEYARKIGARIPLIVSPYARVSQHATLGHGTLVMHGAVVNPEAHIGDNVIINSMALVEHDVIIGNHCHIATGARVNGNVEIGSGVFIGSGAIIKNGVQIGPDAIIGAGVCVKSNVSAGEVMT